MQKDDGEKRQDGVSGTNEGYSSCLSFPSYFCIRLDLFCVLISTLFLCFSSAPSLHAKVLQKTFGSLILTVFALAFSENARILNTLL